MWGFPKLKVTGIRNSTGIMGFSKRRGTILGVPIRRIFILLGSIGRPLMLEDYHLWVYVEIYYVGESLELGFKDTSKAWLLKISCCFTSEQ